MIFGCEARRPRPPLLGAARRRRHAWRAWSFAVLSALATWAVLKAIDVALSTGWALR